MRILANENIPRAAVVALREHEFDVSWIRELAPGSSDSQVLERAAAEARIILTFDKDFGELAFRSAAAGIVGVILCRFAPSSSEAAAARLSGTIPSRGDWEGHFAVIEEDRIRLTALPRATDDPED
jgi:predicted nuclease of predicted toxin-antitoxin system